MSPRVHALGTALAIAGLLAGMPAAPEPAAKPSPAAKLSPCLRCGWVHDDIDADDCMPRPLAPPEPPLWPFPPADRARREAAARKDARRRLRRLRDAERRGEELVPWQAAVRPLPGEGS